MPRKRDHIVGIILAINCLSAYFVPLECSENSTNIRNVKLDDTTDASRYIMRLAKSAETQAMLNTQVDACDNFYAYSCGRWHRHNPAQLLTNLLTDRFQMLAQAYERRLENFLDDFNNATADELTRQVRDFYVSCQLVEVDHISYVLHLENVYKEFSTLPVLSGDNWQEETDFNWWQTIADIQLKYGKQILLAVDNTSSGIVIGEPKLMKPLDRLEVINNLERLFGVEHETALRTADEMLEFEKNIINGGSYSAMAMDLKDRLVVKQLKELDVDGFSGSKFLEAVFGNEQEVPNEINLNENYVVNALNNIRLTPKRTLANYILWQLLQEYMVDSTLKYLPRNCKDLTRKYYSKYLDYAVYKTYRSEEMENDVRNVWEKIRQTFRDTLQGDKLDWISNSTRSYALEKLNAMSLRIQSYDDIDFNEIYANLSVNRLGYVENVRNLLIVQNKERLRKFSQPATDSTTSSFSTVYNAADNSISIPVALLQPRFFWDKNYPQAIKYATLGYLIAHEMIRGFDDEGRHYDMHGNESDWWDEKSTYEFESRRKCLSAQYETFRKEGRKLSGKISQTDNIADNAAVRLAYRAYMRWLDKQLPLEANIEQQETLPGLTFDNRQLFFVSFAQLWCVDVQMLFKLPLSAADTHAPNQYRVNGPLANFQEFSWVFKCRPDAHMDPSYKCYLY